VRDFEALAVGVRGGKGWGAVQCERQITNDDCRERGRLALSIQPAVISGALNIDLSWPPKRLHACLLRSVQIFG
jgi:hypothetical protein